MMIFGILGYLKMIFRFAKILNDLSEFGYHHPSLFFMSSRFKSGQIVILAIKDLPFFTQ